MNCPRGKLSMRYTLSDLKCPCAHVFPKLGGLADVHANKNSSFQKKQRLHYKKNSSFQKKQRLHFKKNSVFISKKTRSTLKCYCVFANGECNGESCMKWLRRRGRRRRFCRKNAFAENAFAKQTPLPKTFLPNARFSTSAGYPRPICIR